ncbi:MAG TPA: DUF4198 domain-containing protein [Pyrinomonadaceae bacterium]|nr:DUF4198 domain-containing protein [Pyrinomonadaceae bacterium]
MAQNPARRAWKFAAFVLILAAAVSTRAVYLELDSYFLRPHSLATVSLRNQYFIRSDGFVTRDRIRDVSLFGPNLPGSVSDSVAWRDEGKTTMLEVKTSGPGTYLVGIATKPRDTDLSAAEFNDYLHNDGLPDTLADRRRKHELHKDVRERYSKNERAVFQVGDQLSDDYKRPLGYPVEIIPQENPYSLKVGDTITVICTLNGRPLVNQFVQGGWESRDGHQHLVRGRTGPDGKVSFKLAGAGKWYLQMIHMTRLADPELDYESKWANLTFEVQSR